MRSEEDIALGVLRVKLGGEEKVLRELRIAELESWQGKLSKTWGSLGKLNFTSPADISKIADQAGGPLMRQLVLAYDVKNELGGEAWLKANATNAQVYRAFKAMLEAAYPFVDDLTKMASLITTLGPLGEPSAPENSTNGHSPTGDSIPKVSTNG